MKKLIGVFVVLTLVGLLGWQVYQKVQASKISATGGGSGWSGGGRGGVAVAVEIAEVQQQSIQDAGHFTGSLSPKSQFIVAPKVSGRLKQLVVDVGDRVERGQLIATLEDDVFLQELQKSKADLEVAKANLIESQSALNVAQREFERAKTLSQKDILSQSGLDSAKAKLDSAVAKKRVSQALVNSRQSSIKTAEVQLSYTKVHADWESGDAPRVVGERFVDEGTILKTNEPIISVLDLSSITCVIQVIERDYFKILQGQQAVIATDAFPGKTFTGSVARIAPLLKEQSRQARIEIDIPNPEELLKPGMFVRVEIEFDTIENATVVPVAALVKRNEQQGVFVADVKNMAAHFVPVTIGVMNSQRAQIIEPPMNGSVVTLGQYLLEDGSRIVLPHEQKIPLEGTQRSPQGEGDVQRQRGTQ